MLVVIFSSQNKTLEMLPLPFWCYQEVILGHRLCRTESVLSGLLVLLPAPVHQIWVSSPHNATGYYTVYGEETLHADHFSARLSFGDTQTIWARTGYLGFLRRTELTDASGGKSSWVKGLPQHYRDWGFCCCSLGALNYLKCPPPHIHHWP